MQQFLVQPDYQARSVVELRNVIGGGRALGFHTGDDFACLTVDATAEFRDRAKDVKRSVAVLDRKTIVTFDLITAPSGRLDWKSTARHSRNLQPAGGDDAGITLAVAQEDPIPDIHPVGTMDVTGLRVADWVVLFSVEPRPMRSAFSFETSGPPSLRFLLMGLAGGSWDVWRDGWLEDSPVIPPQAGALRFNGRPGSYFLRRFS